VPWPVGPSGNQATQAFNYVQGNYWGIPRGIENPADVFEAYFDLVNWYNFDYSNTFNYDIIDDDDVPMSWNEQVFRSVARTNWELADNNIRFIEMMMNVVTFDPYGSLNIDTELGGISLDAIIQGDVTPAQWVETFKQPVEYELRRIYGGGN
jgi:hypothetical protein